MPHISDGDLHAWNDGAFPKDSQEGQSIRQHLGTCPDCRSRLEEARQVTAETVEILAGAAPDPARMPAFEELRTRVAAGVEQGEDGGRSRTSGALRVGWRSIERLAWAATVVLALGAGWIGRSVLIEKGWSDPFHESGLRPEAVAGVQTVESPEDEASSPASEDFALDTVARYRKSEADRVEGPAAAPSRRNVAAKAAAEPDATGALARRERSAAGPPVEDKVDVGLDMVAEVEDLERAQELRLEENVVRPDTGDVRAFAQPASIRPAQDPWHQVPDRRRVPATAETGTCFRLETGWSTGVASLPGRIELSGNEAETGPEEAVFGVAVLDRTSAVVLEAVWATFGADSLWVRFVIGPDADVFTIRAGRDENEWVGEARVLSPVAVAQGRERRGPARLVPIDCS